MGDVLLSLCALRSLRHCFPSHDLVLIAREDVGQVLKQGGEIDACISRDRAAVGEMLAGLDITDQVLRQTLGRCTHAVCWVADPRGMVRRNLYRYGVPNCIALSIQSRELRGVHAKERYVESLAPWQVQPVPMDRSLALAFNEREPGAFDAWMDRATQSGTPIFAVHPGSGSPDKCCPPGILAAGVIGVWNRWKCGIMVCHGPADRQHVDRFTASLDATPHVTSAPDTLWEMTRLLVRVDFFLGHDSGLTHLAAVLGIPTVAIFGPTRPEEWAPEGRHVAILTGAPCECAGWADIRRCREKPCLHILPARIVEAVEAFASDERLRTGRARLPSPKDVC